MPASSPKTWRVRGIHTSCVRTCLQAMAAEVPIRVRSLAIEAHGRSQTATITLVENGSASSETQQPIHLRACAEHSSIDGDSQQQGPPVDEDFLGLTTLYAPPPDHHKIDILAISGLGGHAFGSFKERGGDHMWLRDALPQDIRLPQQHDYDQSGTTGSHPMARVIIYGYSSPVAGSSSVQNVDDLAGQLRQALSIVAPAGTHLVRPPRPVVVLSHSLGGLVLKEALITLAASEDPSSERLRGSLHSFVFFGVPHLGMDNESLVSMAGLHGLNMDLVRSIGWANSGFLLRQAREFPAALKRLGQGQMPTKVFCFYETAESPTAVCIDGKWERKGPKAFLVSVSSATDCIPHADKRDHQCAIDREHSEIVKYSREDPVYDLVSKKLQEICSAAVSTAADAPMPDATSASDLRSKVTTMIPIPRNKNFTGRESTLTMLDEKCFSTDAVTPVILVGLGGIGKSQITLEFLYRVQERMPEWSIFWISALSMDTFTQSCSEIVRELGLAAEDGTHQARDVREVFKKYLSEDGQVGKWILVVDNADDVVLFREMRQYLPHNERGITLVTTRNEGTGSELSERPHFVDLGVMTVDDGQRLLEKLVVADRVPDYSDESAIQLLAALEMLPLAIAQAAAYLSRNRLSIREYVDLLQGREEEARQLLSEVASSAGQWPQKRQEPQYNAALRTWLVSVEQILRDENYTGRGRGPTTEVLMLLSRVEPKAIPKAMLSEVGGGGVAHASAVGTLLQYALLTKREGDMYDMHSLVHLAIRAWVSDRQLSDDARITALECLERKMTFRNDATDMEIRIGCIDYLPHAMRVVAECKEPIAARYWLMFRVLRGLEADGQQSGALKWMQAFAEDAAAVFGPDSEEYKETQCNLVIAHLNVGQAATALPLAKALVAHLQTHPASDEWRIWAHVHYARALRDCGHDRQAFQVLNEVAPFLRTDHPEWPYVQTELANAHRGSGEPDRAIPIYKHILQVLDARHDGNPANPRYREIAKYSLALAYMDDHQPSAALTLLMPLVAVEEAQYAPHHGNRLWTRVLSAQALLGVGEPAKALPILQDVVEIARKKHAANSSISLDAHFWLAIALLAMAKANQAVDLLECAIQSSPSETIQHQKDLKNFISMLRDVYEALGDRGNVTRLDERLDETNAIIDELRPSQSETSDEDDEPNETEPSIEEVSNQDSCSKAAETAAITPTSGKKRDKLKTWFKRHISAWQ